MTNILSGKILVPKLWVKCSQPIILQKDVRGEFDFLHEDTQQSFLQADIVFVGHSEAQSAQNSKFPISL